MSTMTDAEAADQLRIIRDCQERALTALSPDELAMVPSRIALDHAIKRLGPCECGHKWPLGQPPAWMRFCPDCGGALVKLEEGA